MKRVWRWLFNLAAGVSLVLCLATVVLWVRSYWVFDSLTAYTNLRHTPQGQAFSQYMASSMVGRCTLSFLPNGKPRSPGLPVVAGVRYSGDTRTFNSRDYRTLAIHGLTAFDFFSGAGGIDIQFPYWAVVALTLPLPLLWYRNRKRTKRRKEAGLCPSCGYDLRATPDRCPECGMIPAAAKGATA